MSSTYSTGGQEHSDSHVCDACPGQIVNGFCELCGLESSANTQIDHHRYDGAGDRYETLDRSTNAGATIDTRDHQGRLVSPDYRKRLRNANKQEKFSRPYNSAERRQRQFNQHVQPHLHQIRSMPGDEAMMVGYKELYDALVGQSDIMERAQLRQRNAFRTGLPKAMTSRVMAAVLVHELERDPRPLLQKLSDRKPYKYAVAKNSQSDDVREILARVETGWAGWSNHAFETIRKYAVGLLRHLNGMHSPKGMKARDAVDAITVRHKHGMDERKRQLNTMFSVVCQAYSPILSGISSSMLEDIHLILHDANDPNVQRYPMMDTAPNHLMNCQLEIVLQVLQYVYPDAKMKRTKVHRALREGSNLAMPSSSCASRTYKRLAEYVVFQLEAGA